MNGCTHLMSWLVDKISDWKYKGLPLVCFIWENTVVIWRVFDLTVTEFGDVTVVILFGDEVEFVLFDEFVGHYICQQTTSVRIDIGEENVLLIFSCFNPCSLFQRLNIGRNGFFIAHFILFRNKIDFYDLPFIK